MRFCGEAAAIARRSARASRVVFAVSARRKSSAMNDDMDSRPDSDVTRLFPLPKVVLFPHVVLPLHIFEPRYRQMTEDALAGDRLITIVQIKAEAETAIEPTPIEQVGCLGEIIRCERLLDGRFNLLLLGRKRVRLRREPPSGRLYRTAEFDVLDDLAPGASEDLQRAGLVDLFRRVVGRQHALDPDLSKLLDVPAPLGILADVMAHALSLPIELKQALLGEPSVEKRCATIQSVLERLEQIDDSAHRTHPFPPDFSRN
jgi:uncharacterized protein